jgi:2-amino-4-hydroxy-6-hydroxymethyldihydropteridine diphosphokinase
MPAIFLPMSVSTLPISAPIRAYVALGANLGAPAATVRAALAALERIEGARLVAASALYRTAPVGLRDQPDFINAVAAMDVDGTVLPAPTFLAALFAIEAAFGRVRSVRNAPRTLDLDLLLYGDARQDDPALTLPHPRLAERAFVLAPLAEIAPTLEIGGLGRVADLLARVADQRIDRLA